MKASGSLRWLLYPQLIITIILVCLLVGAAGAVERNERLPEVPKAPQSVLDEPEKAAVNCATNPCLALTFDDGPSAVNTPVLLDILSQHKVSATFFVVGSHIKGKEAILKRMYASGHEIGNHSWSHPNLTKLSPKEVRAQINTTQMSILAAGVPAPRLLRPPYGATNAVVETQVPLTIVRWNIDPEDWIHRDSDDLAVRIVQQSKPGGILLLHDTNPHTVAAMAKALPDLKTKYQFVTVSELLGISSGSQGQYFGR